MAATTAQPTRSVSTTQMVFSVSVDRGTEMETEGKTRCLNLQFIVDSVPDAADYNMTMNSFLTVLGSIYCC